MDNFKQRNEIKDFMAPLFQNNVYDHELPTFEDLAWTVEEIDELDQYMTGVGESSHSQVLKKVGLRRNCKPGCTNCLINRLSNLHTNPRNQWWFDIAIKKPGGNIGSGRGISQPILKIPEHPLPDLSEGAYLSEFHRDNAPFSGCCPEDSEVIQSPNCSLDRECRNISQYSPTDVLHPSASALGETLLLGTKFAPIEIPDSPDRDNSSTDGPHSSASALGETLLLGTKFAPIEIPDGENSSDLEHQEHQRSNKGKRIRDPEPIVQVQCSSPSKKAKRVKILHGSQNKASIPIPPSAPLNAPMYAPLPERTEIELPSIQIGSDGTRVLAIRDGIQHVGGGPGMEGSIDHLPSELGSVLLSDSALINQRNEGELQSLEANVDGTTRNARSDGVDYMDGRIVIPQGRDMVLEELLGEPNLDGTTFNARSDGVDYMDGRIVIPQGRDMVLEELLGEPGVQETSGHLSYQLGSISINY